MNDYALVRDCESFSNRVYIIFTFLVLLAITGITKNRNFDVNDKKIHNISFERLFEITLINLKPIENIRFQRMKAKSYLR